MPVEGGDDGVGEERVVRAEGADEGDEGIGPADLAEREGGLGADGSIGVGESAREGGHGAGVGELAEKVGHLEADAGVRVVEEGEGGGEGVRPLTDDGPGERLTDARLGLVAQAVEQFGQRGVVRGFEGCPEPDPRLGVTEAFGEGHHAEDVGPAGTSGVREGTEAREKLALGGEPLLDEADVALEHGAGVEGGVVEGGGDLVEAEPEGLEVLDVEKAAEVVGGVQPVVTAGSGAGDEQAEVVVVAESAQRQAAAAGHLADAEPVVVGVHGGNRSPGAVGNSTGTS